jgi:DNA-binding LytR/AlgR family response regulator
MTIKCFVLDDEPLAAKLIQDYIERLPHLELSGMSNSPTQALGMLQKNPVDILFLDIQMPNLTGFDVLRPLSYKPKVIFTTAHREFALDCYEFDVVDFLLKPISFERFLQAVGKVYRFLPQTLPLQEDTVKKEREYQYFKVDKEMVKIFLDEILWFESLKDYVKIHTLHGVLVSYLRISYLEEKLPDEQFTRIHKSFLISMKHIQALTSNYVRIAGKEIPIGRSYKSRMDAVLKP